MSVSLHAILMYMFPDSPEPTVGAVGGAWVLQDDGEGPYIKEWRRNEPQPTQEEIDAAAANYTPSENKVSIEDKLGALGISLSDLNDAIEATKAAKAESAAAAQLDTP